MSASEPQLDRVQNRQLARFERMGLRCRVMPGGRTLLVSLPVAGGPFESIADSLTIDRLLFSTVGADVIKCLRPQPFFSLPLLDIRRCADAAAIEAVVRQAWRDRTRELRDTGRTLGGLGIEVEAVAGGSLLAFALAGEPSDRPVLLHRLDEAILPTTGALSGHRLEGVAERVIDLSGGLDSAADVGLLLASRVNELARVAAGREQAKRFVEARPAPTASAPGLAFGVPSPPQAESRPHAREPKVLIVGAQLVENAALRDELRQRGYRLATARSETEALMRLAAMTPDLVISQYALGRSDGATFVQAIRALPGIVRSPVVLLDSTHNPSRESAARAVGASGYVIEPFDTTRFVTKLARVVASPGDRRFVRYSDRLVARISGQTRPSLATEIGRGGCFIAMMDSTLEGEEARCEIKLPELHRNLSFVGDVLYRSDQQGVDRQGIGVRIREISSEDEAALIAYVAMRAQQA